MDLFWVFPALFSLIVLSLGVLKPSWYWDGHPSMRRMRSSLGEKGATALFILVALMLGAIAVVSFMRRA